MKLTYVMLSLAVVSGGLAFASAASAKPFTMTCVSGGSMSLSMGETASGVLARNKKLTGTFKYKRAAQGANKKAPDQGQCAWQHRAISAKEGSEASFMTSGSTGIKVTRRGTSATIRDGIGLEKLARYIAQPGQRFSLIVSLQRRGKRSWLRIEKVH